MKETDIRKYAELMKELGLTGLEITEENSKVRIERSVTVGAKETVYSVPESASAVQPTTDNKDYISVKSPIVGVFYVAQDFIFEKDAVVYSDTELSNIAGTIVAVDTSALTIAFGSIETLSEYEDDPLHYSATNIGEFYVKEALALNTECFSDIECTQSLGVVTYLNLTKICIGPSETYVSNGNLTTHIFITAHAPFTYTTASSKTHHVEQDLILDVVDLCPNDSTTKNFNLFVDCEADGYSLIALSNNIFTQMLEPTEYSANDIWFKILEPLASYIYLLNIWQETNLVPVGVFTLEGGEK